MLTEIDGKWLDLDKVAVISPNRDGCTVYLANDPVPVFLNASADAVACAVNSAQNSKVRVQVSGYVGDVEDIAQKIAARDATEPLAGPDRPEPPQTTPAATKSLTEAASASNGFLWAVAWVQDQLRWADTMDDLFPAEIPDWLLKQLESLQSNRIGLEEALITGKTLCDRQEGGGNEASN